MQFKIDENLPAELAELLQSAGHNAKTVYEQQLMGTKDSVLLNHCKVENRVLVTLDLDFSDISEYPPEKYEGIIVLRTGSQNKSHVLNIFKRLIPILGIEQINERLWIVEESLIRIRRKEK
jgi:predicted nuclease of predicted toxin-antitoxin system